MKNTDLDITISQWTRLGILFGARASRSVPDLERLLLDTARLSPINARLFYLAVTWLSCYGNYVARHRLKHLIETELEARHHPVLAVLLTLAVKHGASRELLTAAQACAKEADPGPLFYLYRENPNLSLIAKKNACPEGLPWGLWLSDQPLKLDALRPALWIVEHNPGYLDRILRKGDLRCSILLTLKLDCPDHSIDSEVALAEQCSANRIAVRHALDDLEREGYPLRRSIPGARNIPIVWRAPKRAALVN